MSSNDIFSVFCDSSRIKETILGDMLSRPTTLAVSIFDVARSSDGSALLVVSRAMPAKHNRNVSAVVLANYNALMVLISDAAKFIAITNPLLLDVLDAPCRVYVSAPG